MYAVSIGQIEEAIYDLEQHFGVDYNGLSNRECVENLRKLCPQLHSEEELIGFAEDLLDEVEKKYGFEGLRVWYRVRMQYAFFGHDMLSTKYWRLMKDISAFINEYREKYGLTLKLDVFLAGVYLKDTYKKKYVVFDSDELMDLYSILRTIHLSNYDASIIESTVHLIETQLLMQGDNYYTQKDLTEKSVLSDLYIHVAEEIGDDVAYEGHKLFYEYDGYGGSYLSV